MQFTHRQLIAFSGIVWILVGIALLNVGLKFLLNPALSSGMMANQWILPTLKQWLGSQEGAALSLVVTALGVGYMKGKHVLAKSARQGIQRILQLSNPASIFSVYSAKYYILLGCMMGIGILMNVFNVPTDLRGWVDVAVGAALIQGSVVYFKQAIELRKHYL